MNERIKQLAEQAFFDEATSQPSDKIYTFSEHKMEKFAELIIKECATVQHKRFCEHGDISWDILMEHFGVEE